MTARAAEIEAFRAQFNRHVRRYTRTIRSIAVVVAAAWLIVTVAWRIPELGFFVFMGWFALGLVCAGGAYRASYRRLRTAVDRDLWDVSAANQWMRLRDQRATEAPSSEFHRRLIAAAREDRRTDALAIIDDYEAQSEPGDPIVRPRVLLGRAQLLDLAEAREAVARAKELLPALPPGREAARFALSTAFIDALTMEGPDSEGMATIARAWRAERTAVGPPTEP